MKEAVETSKVSALDEPDTHGLAPKPVGCQFCDAGKKISRRHLSSKEPESPGGDSLSVQVRVQPGINRERAVGRDENKKKAEQPDEIEVIDVATLIKKEEISVAEEKENGANSIKETNRDKESENAECDPMELEPNARPGFYPGKTGVIKKERSAGPPRSE